MRSGGHAGVGRFTVHALPGFGNRLHGVPYVLHVYRHHDGPCCHGDGQHFDKKIVEKTEPRNVSQDGNWR